MFNVICVLRSGGIYNAEWVRKLRDGVARNLTIPHRFVCLSDCEVPCERIELKHDWPGWWAKIELFRPGVITGPTLYLDLDTVVTGNIDAIANVPVDFAMLRNFHEELMCGSGVMWFKEVPTHVYEKFSQDPQGYIKHHNDNRIGPYVGDQAFIGDALSWNIDKINDYVSGIKSYKYHCKRGLPDDAALVCYHGNPRPTEVKTAWMAKHWK